MKFSYWNSIFLVLILLAQTVTLTRTEDKVPCDPRCRTQDCDAEGVCSCSARSLGALTLHGGPFCDQPSHYCSNSTPGDDFYCVDNPTPDNSNNTCVTLSDRSHTCICQPKYAGDKCQFVGVSCVVGYCYNNATCNAGSTCDCPTGWQGNANCTLASSEESSSGSSGIKWWGALLITGAVVAVVAGGVVFGLKKYRERTGGVSQFNELKKSQMRARESDDDEYDSDPYEDEVAKNNKKAATTSAQP